MSDTQRPPPPYPADTKAKGWRYELDYERIAQSDTWALAEEVPMAQHALMFMWLVAWRQEPCGSMPNDDDLIRSKCRIPPKLWAPMRDVLLRGWWLASDGRLYHPTVTERVLEMVEYRQKTAKRVADFKLKQREQRTGNALLTRESHDKNDTGTGTGTNTEANASVAAKTPRAARKCPKTFAPDGAWAEANHPAVDWRAELEKFRDHTFKTALTDWDGAFRNWIRRAAENRRPAGAVIPINRQEAQEQRNRAVGDAWLRQQQEPADATP